MIPESNYCKSTQPNMFNPELFNGFYDADLKIFVCNDCKELHYKEKLKTKFAYRYSEKPVVISYYKNFIK